MPSQTVIAKSDKQESIKKGPVPVDSLAGQLPAELVENLEEGVQEVHEELRKATISQITLTVLAVLAICYFAKVVLVTIFTAILIAFILEPIVHGLERSVLLSRCSSCSASCMA